MDHNDVEYAGEGEYARHLRQIFRFEIIPTLADGNCLFHSLAHFEDNARDHSRIREEVCTYIHHHYMEFVDDIMLTSEKPTTDAEEYVQYMGTPSIWGTNVEIRAYSEMTATTVVVWIRTDRWLCAYGAEHSQVCHLLLQGNHFQLLKENMSGIQFGESYRMICTSGDFNIVKTIEGGFGKSVESSLRVTRGEKQGSLKDAAHLSRVSIRESVPLSSEKLESSGIIPAILRYEHVEGMSIASYDMKLHMQGKDANSMFICFALHVGECLEKHAHIRILVCDFVRKHFDMFSQDIHDRLGSQLVTSDAYFDFMSKNGVSGTHTELRAFALMMGCGVIVWNSSKSCIASYVLKKASRRGILHLLYDGYHYSLLVVVDAGGVSELHCSTDNACVKRKKSVPISPLEKGMTLFLKACADVPIYPCVFCSMLHFLEKVKRYTKVVDVRCSPVLGRKMKLNEYVCYSCWASICKRKQPKFFSCCLTAIPPYIASLTEFEERIISPRIPFMCIRPRLCGEQKGMKGGVVNVPVDQVDFVKTLPRQISDLHVVSVSLKRQMRVDKVYMEQYVRPNVLKLALQYLCRQSLFVKYGIGQDVEWSVPIAHESEEDCISSENATDTDCGHHEEDFSDEIDDGNVGVASTMLQREFVLGDDIKVVYAPGEGKTPVSLLRDDHVEVLSYPALFGGKDREYATLLQKNDLSYKDVVKWELQHRDRRFALHSSNLFFKLFLCQIIQMNRILSLRIRQHKLKDLPHVRVKDVTDVKNRAILEKTTPFFNEFKLMRGTYQYFQNIRKDVFAMIRQLGRPTFFLTISMADMRWVELHAGLYKVVSTRVRSGSEKQQIEHLIRSDPVTCARYYVHRRQALFKHLLCKATPILGSVIDYFLVDEFQQRGSPHTHCLIWSNNGPDFDTASDSELVSFIDQHISCSQHDMDESMLQVQSHRHTATCRMGRRNKCRFGFPRFPMRKTMFLNPLSSDERSDPEVVKAIQILLKSKDVLPVDASFDDFLEKVSVDEKTYILAIRSQLSHRSIMIQRSYRDRWINNFNPTILKVWNANMDVQPCLDGHAVGQYIVSYMTKVSKGVSSTMKRLLRQMKDGAKQVRPMLRELGNSILNHQEVSAQEAVYLLLGLQMRKSSRAITFINTSPPTDRVCVVKSLAELQKLNPDDTDIFEPYALLQHYLNRPKDMEYTCLADFTSEFDICSRKTKSTYHLDNSDEHKYYVKRKKKKIIRFVNYKECRSRFHFMRERLMLFVPFRKESELDDVFSLYKRHFMKIESKVEEYFKFAKIDFVDDLSKHSDSTSMDKQSRFQVDVAELFPDFFKKPMNVKFGAPLLMLQGEYFQLMRKLNTSQWAFINHVLTRLRQGGEPVRIFLSGGAGVGKSVTIQALDETLNRYFKKHEEVDVTSLMVLKLAPTGCAACNIGGMTVHSALRIPVHNNKDVHKLSPEALSDFQLSLSNIRFVIVDEISLMTSKNLLWLHARLCELKGSRKPFGGLHVVFVGDLFQLRPIGRFVFQSFYTSTGEIPNGLWTLFEFFELHEVMRQKDDLVFATCLNRVREGKHTKADMKVLFSRNHEQLQKLDRKNIYFTNEEVNRHNMLLFQMAVSVKHAINAHDQHSWDDKSVRMPHASRLVTKKSAKDCAGLEHVLSVYIGCEVQIVLNIDVSDGLVNGTFGSVVHFSYSATEVSIIWISFPSSETAKKHRQAHRRLYEENHVTNHSWTPFERVERHFTLCRERSISRRQFPFRASGALTCHRSQGLTFDNGVVHFTGRKYPHYSYVALSRFRKLNDLDIVRFDESWIVVDDEVVEEMNVLRSRRAVRLFAFPSPIKKHLLIYLNVTSLYKYIEDVRSLVCATDCPVAAFVETHLMTYIPDADIDIPSYTSHRFDSRRYGTIVYSKDALNVRKLRTIGQIEITFFLMSFMGFEILMVIVYRSPSNSMSTHFCNLLASVFYNHEYVVIAGDFNADPIPTKLRQMMTAKSLRQLVSQPTHVKMGVLDHVWTNIPNVNVVVLDSYFTDHFPLLVEYHMG